MRLFLFITPFININDFSIEERARQIEVNDCARTTVISSKENYSPTFEPHLGLLLVHGSCLPRAAPLRTFSHPLSPGYHKIPVHSV